MKSSLTLLIHIYIRKFSLSSRGPRRHVVFWRRGSVQDGDTAIGYGTREHQGVTEVMREWVQHGAGLWLIKHQRLAQPVQEHPDPLGSRHDRQGDLLPGVAEGVLAVVVRQHPRLGVVAQPRLVPGAFALQAGVADPDLKGAALAHVDHPAVGARRHQRRTQGIGPTVEPCRVVGGGFAGFFVVEGQSAEVIREGQERAHCALVEL